MKKKVRSLLAVLFLLLIPGLGGCRIGNWYFSAGMPRRYLAAGLRTSLSAQEGNLLFLDIQNRYNAWYGQMDDGSFWEQPVDGIPFADWLKEKRVKNEICCLLLLNDMAAEQGMELEENELTGCALAAEKYWSGLSDLEKKYCQASMTDVASLYRKYRLAQKMIAALTEGEYLEISDNAKRVASLQILCVDSQALAADILNRVRQGGDFGRLAREYSLLTGIDYQVSRGELNPVLEEVAFYLADGECSDVIEANGYYYLVYCENDFDEERSLAHEPAVQARTLYDIWNIPVAEYAALDPIGFSDGIWEKMNFARADQLRSYQLFVCYDNVFQK